MDILFRQLRTKYPEEGHRQDKEGSSTTRDQKIPAHKSQSFKGEKRRSQSWIRRQFSRQMSQDYDPTAGEDYQTAVAAAAFAVKSLEESRTREQKRRHHAPDTPLTKVKSKADDTARVPEGRTKSINFSDEVSRSNLDDQDKKIQISTETGDKAPEKPIALVPSIKKKLSFADSIANSPHLKVHHPLREAIGQIPSVKRTPAPIDKSLSRAFSRKDSAEPKLDVPPPKQPPFQPADTRLQMGDTDADVWERNEMARIKEKYEKLNTTILEWEDKKKKKAKRQLQKIEAELDKRRAKAMQHYRSELARVDGIAAGARSKAIENQRNEEFKAKEKANKIRLTGKVPTTCLCF